MAIAVIGGLVTSTGLTLVLVPAAFTWIDDFERWLGRKVGHHLVNNDSPTPATPAAPPGAVSSTTAPGAALPSTGAAT
jgi:HAE1 family hydrophobic/amphiphilic exporter-1